MVKIDEYLKNVVKLGDEGSDLLEKITAPTIKNCEYAELLEDGRKILRIPEGNFVVVHSDSGDPQTTNLTQHSRSLVDRLVNQAESIGATPIAFADVIDSNTGSTSMIQEIGDALVEKANEYGLAIMTGENAVLGRRINPKIQANVSGTMISLTSDIKGILKKNGNIFAAFDPEGKAVFINSDGVGTKTEFYERSGQYELAVNDYMAMNLDDTVKQAATPRVISGVVETKGRIPFKKIFEHTQELAASMGILGIMQHEDVGEALVGYMPGTASYNISGSVVSTIDEERLKNPLKPEEGDVVLAIKGDYNPRSNGITGKRDVMIDMLGNDWHKKEVGKKYLDFLATPSTILYPVFKELIDNGLASSVYHMSGGAFNGKLAKPLAQHGFFVKLGGLFQPDWRETALADYSKTPNEIAYAKWPMGNDGFITTKYPANAKEVIRKNGLECAVAGVVVKDADGRTGVELKGIKASYGKNVYYSGN